MRTPSEPEIAANRVSSLEDIAHPLEKITSRVYIFTRLVLQFISLRYFKEATNIRKAISVNAFLSMTRKLRRNSRTSIYKNLFYHTVYHTFYLTVNFRLYYLPW